MSSADARDADRGAETHFRDLLEAAPDAIVIVDAEGRIVLVNHQAERVFGYPRRELLAQSIEMLIPSRFRQAHVAHRRRYFDAPQARAMEMAPELCGRRKDGTEFPVEISLSPLATEEGTLVLSAIRDITERKDLEAQRARLAAEQAALADAERTLAQAVAEREAETLRALVESRTTELRSTEERHRVLLDVNNAVVTSLDRHALFDAIFDAVRKVLPFDRASLTLADATRGVSTVQAIASSPHHPELSTVLAAGSDFPHLATPIGRVLDERRAIVFRDKRLEAPVGPHKPLVDRGIRSVIVAPLLSKQGAIGTLMVGSLSPDQYTGAEGDLLTDVGKQLAVAIENMLAYEEIARLTTRLEQENLYLQEEAGIHRGVPELLGETAAIRRVIQTIEIVAPTDATVLITGETGTGKELIARAIHTLSQRRDGMMVKVNCSALPAGLIESELFGHERGAFTGAVARRIGRFELAHRGTILLDEIGDLPLELQPKLLRVLQEGELERVGGMHVIKVDARVIASTNRDLEDAIRTGRFRSDLYYRLSVFPISAPAIRDRKADIAPLVRHFVMKYNARLGRRIKVIPSATMAALERYSWPGNVRELENVIERAVIVSQGPRLELGDWLPHAPGAVQKEASLTLEDVERRHIRSVLQSTGWQVSGLRGAARILGLKPTTLEARMKKLGIKKPPADRGTS